MPVSSEAITRLQKAIDKSDHTAEIDYKELRIAMTGHKSWPEIDQTITGYKGGRMQLSVVNEALSEVFGKRSLIMQSNHHEKGPGEKYLYFRANRQLMYESAQTVVVR